MEATSGQSNASDACTVIAPIIYLYNYEIPKEKYQRFIMLAIIPYLSVYWMNLSFHGHAHINNFMFLSKKFRTSESI